MDTVWIATRSLSATRGSLHDLQVAWLSLMKQARVHQHHKIHREELSVREHMSIILRRLQGGGYVVFDQLFDLTLAPRAGGEFSCPARTGPRVADRNYPERGHGAHLRETADAACINPMTTSACWKPRCWWLPSRCPVRAEEALRPGV